MFKNEGICFEKLGHLAKKWWQTQVIWLQSLVFYALAIPNVTVLSPVPEIGHVALQVSSTFSNVFSV